MNLTLFVKRIYTEWYRYQDEEEKLLIRVYVCVDDSVYSLDCSEEAVKIHQVNDLPEGHMSIDNMFTYWLQEETIEWLGVSPILEVGYLYEQRTGFKRGICLFFKNHHIVYYNPGYEYGDRQVMLYDADLEAIMKEYDYKLLTSRTWM